MEGSTVKVTEPSRSKSPISVVRDTSVIALLLLVISGAAVRAGDIPKVLPASDGKKADPSRPIKVYVMLGQSNMLGFGRVEPKDLKGTLEYFVHEKGKYPHL